ncbi:hypothetical protein B0T25DRAFT_523690 [Lasiosphaeria hispida]|uniref:Uncharacterized protein n=1 Tax=Lasiosphaeria hispida TaxID=260671 RepID=A0AAJ0H4S0_9PEZI|nr:hypothetical protein B0T25DRAFT_523690 [Lasiosphaeria hispida]
MHFLATLLLTLTPATMALKDNTFYITTRYTNGTVVTEELLNPSERIIVQEDGIHTIGQNVNTAPGPARLSKRFTDCWGSQLDESGVDSAVRQWKGYLAGQNMDLTSSSSSTRHVFYAAEGMKVYYCINAKSSSGNLDLKDFNYALEQMDAKCRRYEASYFRWDGSVEIVGKSNEGTEVCRG